MTLYRSHTRYWIFLAVLFGALVSHAWQSKEGPGQDSARQALQKLQDRALDLQKDEQKSPGDNDLHHQRVRAFAEAAASVADYATKYTEASDIKRLLLMYRMAVNLELSEQFKEAKSELHACEQHPRYHDSGAAYNGKQIEVLVPERLAAVDAVMSASPAGKVWMLHPGTYAPGTYVVSSGTHVNGIAPDAVEVHSVPHDLGSSRINPQSLHNMQATGVAGR